MKIWKMPRESLKAYHFLMFAIQRSDHNMPKSTTRKEALPQMSSDILSTVTATERLEAGPREEQIINKRTNKQANRKYIMDFIWGPLFERL